MLLHLLEQLAVLVTALVLLGVPGFASVSLLRIRAALPDTLAVPTAMLLGSLVACVATFAQLAAQVQSIWAIALHVLCSLVLVAAAVKVHRRRVMLGDLTIPVSRGWSRTTSVIVAVGAAFAWAVRGKVGLDGLYHISVSRKLIELADPSFGNINRFADGGPNPTYALPGWHAMVGWTAQLTGGDPIISWEIMPVFVVALGALAAAGLAQVLLNSRRAEVLGALVWVLMRVLYARRSVDGDAILYGAVPGQVVFELVFPMIFAAIAVAMWTESIRVRRAALAAVVPGLALVVIYHANYLPYVVFVGLGYVAWWLVSGPVTRLQWRTTLLVGGVVALASAVFSGVLLPLLAQLENFGNAPEEARIQYHLTTTAGLEHIRGGHIYEMLGIPGVLAAIAAPFVAWFWRSREMYVASGGLLAICTVSFVPPLFGLLAATGSLTLGLRINHIPAALYVPVLAGALLLLADAGARIGRSRWRAALVVLGATIAVVAVSGLLGFQSYYPDVIGYVSWLGLIGVFVLRAVRGRRRRTRSVTAPSMWTQRTSPTSRAVLCASLVLIIGAALPTGALSMRRALADAEPLAATPATGDLKCVGGPVFDAMQQMRPGTVILSDPGASFQAMAVAPVYVVGDYKIWNSATGDNRTVERLALVNRFFDSSATDAARLDVLVDQGVDYLLVNLGDGRWIDATELSDTERELVRARTAFDRFADVQSYDGGSVARLVQAHPDRFELLEADERGRAAALPARRAEDHVSCNAYALWKVR